MTREDKPILAVLFAGVLIVGIGIGGIVINWEMKAEAIDQGCAAYDTKTGDWGWKK